LVDRESFRSNVEFRTCDMNNIPDDLTGYDFCWSSCSLEHLGDLQKGLDFVVESVERTLRPGGFACHTTELNVSSDTDTVEDGPTVLYRRRDIRELVDRLERRGHQVAPFVMAPDKHVLDFFVDTPPYLAPPHLKLQLLGYTATSAGFIVQRASR
jgi:SAM-dependent methyltransferase